MVEGSLLGKINQLLLVSFWVISWHTSLWAFTNNSDDMITKLLRRNIYLVRFRLLYSVWCVSALWWDASPGGTVFCIVISESPGSRSSIPAVYVVIIHSPLFYIIQTEGLSVRVEHDNIRIITCWKFPAMVIQHSVKIWLTVQHSVKINSSWLVDVKASMNINMPYWII